MPRIGIQYQDVESVAAELVQEGISVTHEHVRARLGTGSSNTLSRHLKRWRETSLTQDDTPALPSSLSQHVANVWRELSTSAENRINDITMMAQLIVTTLMNENVKLRENGRRWQALHEKWKAEKTELYEKLDRQHHSIKEHEAAYIIAQHNNAVLNSVVGEKQQHIESLGNNALHSQKNLEHFREAARAQLLKEQDKQAQLSKTIETIFITTTKNIECMLTEDKVSQSIIINKLEQLNEEIISKENASKETNELLYANQRAISEIQAQLKNTLPKFQNYIKRKNKIIL